jgi:hypothetical protein
LGHLPENAAAPIEILSGACMFLRQKARWTEVGLLDESFFMYGEDIDLSYRITLGRLYVNWYLPEARIIHYKGESTKKSSVNYVFVFLQCDGHFRAEALRAAGAAVVFPVDPRGHLPQRSGRHRGAVPSAGALLPMLDLLLIGGAQFLLLGMDRSPWSGPGPLVLGTLLTLAVLGLFGAYDAPMDRLKAGKGLLALAVLGVPALLLRQMPPGPLALAWIATALMVGLSRVLMLLLKGRLTERFSERPRILAVGSEQQAKRALALLWQTHYGLGREAVLDPGSAGDAELQARIAAQVRAQRADQVVFCAQDLPMRRVIALMEDLAGTGAVFKIARPDASFIIGPSTTESLQDLQVLHDHSAGNAASRRQRRLLDLSLAAAFTAGLPVLLLLVHARQGFLRNLWEVWRGERSWMGYHGRTGSMRLPRLLPGVIDIVSADRLVPEPLLVRRMNLEYAKDYQVWKDLLRVLGNVDRLGVRRT